MRASTRSAAARADAPSTSVPARKAAARLQAELEGDDDVEMLDAMDVSPAPATKQQARGTTRSTRTGAAGSMGAAKSCGAAATGQSQLPAAGVASAHVSARTPAAKAARMGPEVPPSPMDMSPCPAVGTSMQPLASPSTRPAQQQQLPMAAAPTTAAHVTASSGSSVPPITAACQPFHAADLLRSRLLSRSGNAAPSLPYPAPRPASSSSSRTPPPAPASWALPLRPSLQAAHDTLVATMSRVVQEEGCTAAVLLLGERGTGKTLAVERALQTLATKHNTSSNTSNSTTAGRSVPGEAAAGSSAAAGSAAAAAAGAVPGAGEGDKPVGVVRISGLLHLDERAAFQEIARQLCGEFQQLFAKSATYDENLAFLRNMLQALHRCMKTVVFIVDELDAFTRKGKQMLLYNLLDTLAHSKVQACVVGISCMQDVMDHMEKRVRSRFSAQRILVTPPLEFEPRAPQAAPTGAGPSNRTAAAASQAQAVPVPYEDTPLGILQAMLSLPTPPGTPTAGGAAAAGPSGSSGGGFGAAAATVGAAQGGSRGAAAGPGAAGADSRAVQGLDSGFAQRHNACVTAALQDAGVKAALKQAFNVRLRPRDLANIAQCTLLEWTLAVQQQQAQQLQQQAQQQQQAGSKAPAAAAATGPEVALSAQHVLRAVQQHMAAHSSSQGDQLAGLSVLQLFLVVAMYRLAFKGCDLVNFEMAYEELRGIQLGSGSSRGDEQYKWGRGTALRSFQGLLLSGIAAQVGGGQSGERVVGRGAAYAGAELRAGKAAIEGALRAKGSACPELLLRFFRLEA